MAVRFWRAASNRRGKKTDGEGEQHECPEGIDRDVYGTCHLNVTQLITIGSSYELNQGLSERTIAPASALGRNLIVHRFKTIAWKGQNGVVGK